MFRKTIAILIVVLMLISIVPLNTLTVFAAAEDIASEPEVEGITHVAEETVGGSEPDSAEPTESPTEPQNINDSAAEDIAPVGEGELAESGNLNDNITWRLDRATGSLVLSGTGPMPSYNNNNSWNVFHSPFHSSSEIKSVTINEGITTVGSYSFTSCKELSTVSIPDSVTEIGDGAFIYSGVYYFKSGKNVELIRGNAFYGCTNLTEAVLNEGLKKILDTAFHACYSLLCSDICQEGKRNLYHNYFVF